MEVAFFGHSDTPSDVYPLLAHKVQELIEQNDEITFYVGTHGIFDSMAQHALKNAVKKYPHINAHIVLAYYEPTVKKEEWKQYDLPTVYPEGIETVPKRFAIDYRNRFMVKECDTVICYISHDWGGAVQFVEYARKLGKKIINLADSA